jgi:hypothetical protein
MKALNESSGKPRRRLLTSVALFYGCCSLCRASRKWAARLDWLGLTQWISFRDPRVRAHVPQLTDEQLQKEMWVIRSDGAMLPGFAGWRQLVKSYPLTFLPALLLYVPPIPFLGRPFYAFLAARRPIRCELRPAIPVPDGDWKEILQRARQQSSASRDWPKERIAEVEPFITKGG